MTVPGSFWSKTLGGTQGRARVAWDPKPPGYRIVFWLALTLCPAWALLLVWGSSPLCREMEQGVPWTGSCLQSHEEPCEQVSSSQAESLRASASCL